MNKYVAIGGGDLEFLTGIHKYIISLTGKANPELVYIGAANSDNVVSYKKFYRHMAANGCHVTRLVLTVNELSEEFINNILLNADIVYLGGGNTKRLMEYLEKYKLKEKLDSMQKDFIIAGISAGAIALCQSGYSDFKADEFNFIAGLGFVDKTICVHYNETKRQSFDLELGNLEGYGLENNTALVKANEQLYYITTFRSAKIYHFIDGIKNEVESELVY